VTRAKKDAAEIDCLADEAYPRKLMHKAAKIAQDGSGRVSALCFAPHHHPIDMERETWTITDSAVTCQKCRAMLSRSPSAKRKPRKVKR